MTNREAIEWLKGCVVSYEVDNKGKPNGNITCDLTQEVLDMAISALEKQEAQSSTVKSHSEKEILRECIGLLSEMVGHFSDYMEWLGYNPTEEERECGYFGMTYFHIVQRLFLFHTRHGGGTSTYKKCYELGIDDPSEGVRFPLWDNSEREDGEKE